jgi:hypothetical protein
MWSSIILVAAGAALATSLSACTDSPGQEAGASPPEAADESATEGSAAEPQPDAPPTDDAAAAFRPEMFGEDSATIDNEWWPLPVGSRFVWEGQAIEGEETVERQVVFTVTDLTKVIHGVRTRVGWDRDYNDGVLGEGELIFLAQDTEGTVWHFGQYTEVYEDEFVGGRLWVVDDPVGAKAGILMKAAPKPGDPSYSQGYAPPPWNWDDRAQLRETGVRTCVAIGCFDDVMVIEEFEPSKPDAQQLKYYARGVGTVKIGWAGEAEEEHEEMELVERVSLTPDELAEARAAALEMEHRGYAYARTTPAEPMP